MFFGIGSFIMGALEMVSPMAAMIQMVLWLVIMFVLWKKVHEKYF